MEKALKRKGNNPLLARDDVGKCKPCSYPLPSEGFSYGRPDLKDPEGAKEVTSSWAYHQQSKVGASKKDFLSMNRFGGKVGEKTEMKMSTEPKHFIQKGNSLPEDMVYGVMNRPSTPIEGVISNTYGEYAEKEAEEIYKNSGGKPKGKKKKMTVRPTKASEKILQYK